MTTSTSKVIEIVVHPDGRSVVQTKGFTGNECRQASRFIEQALGQRDSEQLTAEFYTSTTAAASVQQRS